MTTPLFVRTFAEFGSGGLEAWFLLFSWVNATVSAAVLGGFLVLSLPFFRAWVGDTLDPMLCTQISVIVLLSRLIAFVTLPLSSVLTAINAPKMSTASAGLETVVSVATIALLVGVSGMGILGTAIGALIGTVVGRAVLLPFLVQARFKFEWRSFGKAVLRPFVRFAPFGAIAIAAGQMLPSGISLVGVAAAGIAYVLLGGLYTVVMLPEEDLCLIREHFNGPWVQIIGRIRALVRFKSEG